MNEKQIFKELDKAIKKAVKDLAKYYTETEGGSIEEHYRLVMKTSC